MARARVDQERIRTLERELRQARQAGFQCPDCGATEYAEQSVWRGGDEAQRSGERYHYWACLNGHDVTALVAPVSQPTRGGR